MIDVKDIITARNSNLLDYMRVKGYRLKKTGQNEYRLVEHDSLVISNNKWHWFSRGIGGNTVDFLVKYEGMGFKEAIKTLSGTVKFSNNETQVMQAKFECKKNNLILPDKYEKNYRVKAYLNKTRKIDRRIIEEMLTQNKLYESTRHNCVFIGRDISGNIKFACERGTLSGKSYKGDCAGSDKRYSFFIEGTSDKVFVFESPIDALSHATIFKLTNRDYTHDHRIALCSLSEISLLQYLEDRSNIKNIILCLDNDQWGVKACYRIKNILDYRGFNVEFDLPTEKDYNQELIKMKKDLILVKTKDFYM